MREIILTVPWTGSGAFPDFRRPDLSGVPELEGLDVVGTAVLPDQDEEAPTVQVRVTVRPKPPTVLPIAEFRKRIASVLFRLPAATPELKEKWDRIDKQLLSSFTEVDLEDPLTVGMLGELVKDGLLTAEEMQAALTPSPLPEVQDAASGRANAPLRSAPVRPLAPRRVGTGH